jgi:WD40 repeat protein
MATGSSRNNKVILWHIQPDFMNVNVNIVQTLEEHTRAIESIAFHPSGHFMATGSQDYTVRLYHITFTENNMQAICINTLTIHNGNGMILCSIPSIIFHPTKNILATSCSLMGSFQVPSLKEIKLLEISSNDSFESCNMDRIKSLTNTHKMKSIAFNSTGNLMATGDNDSKIKLWHITDDILMTKCVKTIEERIGPVNSVAFHPNQNILATGCSDETIRLWRISSDESFVNWEVRCIIILKGHMYDITSISFHKRYPFLATCSQDKIKIWKLNEYREVEGNGEVENNNSNGEMNRNRRPQIIIEEQVENNGNSNSESSNLNSRPQGRIYSNNNSSSRSNSNNNNNISNLQHLTRQQLIERLIGQPIQHINNRHHTNYISQVQRLTRQQLIEFLTRRQQRAQQRPPGINQNVGPPIQRRLFNNISPPNQQQIEERITISEKLLNPVKNSKNSCPNFDELYKFIMRQNLSGRFFFIYEGSNHKVVDYGGARRDVFDKILPVYTKKFFKEIEENEDYVILREDVDMDTLIRETEQLILLATSASETKIFLKIDPILLSLLKGNQFTYFNNNKRNSFSNLYEKFNQYIEHSNNDSQLLRNKNNSKLIETLKSENLKNEVLVKTLKQEIRFRRFAITRGFTNMEQFNKMAQFIRKFYYRRKSFITCVLKFDIETILKRIKLFKKIKINDLGDYHKEPIPLEQYIRLSQNKQNLFNDITIYNIVKNYPYLIPFLNFILGPESSDDDRKLFIQRLSGSSSYTGELIIYLSYLSHIEARRLPFYFATCEKYLEIFINREQNRRRITSEAIRTQLLSDTGFGLA